MAGILLRLAVDTSDAKKAITDLQNEIAAALKQLPASVPQVAPPPASQQAPDPKKQAEQFAQLGVAIDQTASKGQKLSEVLNRSIKGESVDELTKRLQGSQAEMARLENELNLLKSSLQGIDPTKLTPKEIAEHQAKVKRLGDAYKQAYSEAASAAAKLKSEQAKIAKADAEAAQQKGIESFLIRLGEKLEVVEEVGELLPMIGQAATGMTSIIGASTTEAIQAAGDTAQAFGSIGFLFGPVVGIVAAGLGAIIGYFNKTSEQATKFYIETEKAHDTFLTFTEDLAAGIDTSGLAELVGKAGQARDKLRELRQSLEGPEGEGAMRKFFNAATTDAETIQKRLDLLIRLREAGVENVNQFLAETKDLTAEQQEQKLLQIEKEINETRRIGAEVSREALSKLDRSYSDLTRQAEKYNAQEQSLFLTQRLQEFEKETEVVRAKYEEMRKAAQEATPGSEKQEQAILAANRYLDRLQKIGDEQGKVFDQLEKLDAQIVTSFEGAGYLVEGAFNRIKNASVKTFASAKEDLEEYKKKQEEARKAAEAHLRAVESLSDTLQGFEKQGESVGTFLEKLANPAPQDRSEELAASLKHLQEQFQTYRQLSIRAGESDLEYAERIAKLTGGDAKLAKELISDLQKEISITQSKTQALAQEQQQYEQRKAKAEEDREKRADDLHERELKRIEELSEKQKKAQEEEEKRFTDLQNKYKAALEPIGIFTDEILSTIEDNIANEERALFGLGEATKRATGQILKALGKKWGILAGEQFAAGLASLAMRDRKGAGLHFASSAGYGAAAVAAGVGGAIISGRAERRAREQEEQESGEVGRGASRGNSSAFTGGSRGSEVAFSSPVVVNISGAVLFSDERSVANFGNASAKAIRSAIGQDPSGDAVQLFKRRP